MNRLKKGIFLVFMLAFILSAGVSVQAATSTKAVVFHDNSGNVIKIVRASEGKVKLFSVENEEGYTFLGWSEKPNQHKNPDYKAGETIRVNGRKNLYAVMFKRSSETDIPAGELPVLDTGKYSAVIFVGDSRTVGMKNTLEKQCSKKALKNVYFVCQSGRGLSWFRSRGLKQMLEIIKNVRKNSSAKPVAIVFNLGVNDIRHRNGVDPDCSQVVYNYLTYMNKLSGRLPEKSCKLFYMSINPINSTMSITKGIRREEEILYFNRGLQGGLNSRWTYIDTFGRLMSNGYSTGVASQKTDDGTHYTPQTYKRIYKYCIDKVNRS